MDIVAGAIEGTIIVIGFGMFLWLLAKRFFFRQDMA